MIWGAAMLANAVIRVTMVWTLPVNAVPALGAALWPVTFIVLQVITNVYFHRAGLWLILGADPTLTEPAHAHGDGRQVAERPAHTRSSSSVRVKARREG